MTQQRTVAAYTLGCKVNQYETEAVLELFRNRGYLLVPFSQVADVYLINTCSVTAMSDQKNRQVIRKAIKQNPQAVIAVMGCYGQAAPQEVAAISGVSIVLGTKDRQNLPDLVEEVFVSRQALQQVSKSVLRNTTLDPLSIEQVEGHTRAFVKIQDGCTQFCSYCIIPFTRGALRSRSLSSLSQEVQRLAANGYQEIVLVGIHLSSYGKNMEDRAEGITLLDAIRCVAGVEGIQRIRLGSLEPLLISEHLLQELAKEPKFCHHFHLALQSGSDAVLARMNRQYTSAEFRQIVEWVRRYFPDAAITTDIMVGFPGETEAEFQESMDFAREIGFARMHVFPYSVRPGTAAAKRIDQISPLCKKSRAEQMGELASVLERRFLNSLVGRLVPVLLESRTRKRANDCTQEFFCGYTGNYVRILVPVDGFCRQGSLCLVRITEICGDSCLGIVENRDLGACTS